MKIILLKDIPKVGRKFEVKDVAEGFAQNMLFPRGLAMIATTNAIKKLEGEKAKLDAEKKIQGELLLKNLETIKSLKIVMKEKVNEKGHLFAGVTKEMIIAEVIKTARLNLDPESVDLEKPLKTVGEHKVTVHALGKKAEFTVVIEAE